MRKIYYRPVFNRKNHLNAQGTALLQVEAYLERRKIYFSSHIYLRPDQWDDKKLLIKHHPHADDLNVMLKEFILKLERKELELWRNGCEVSLDMLREECKPKPMRSFLRFVEEDIATSQVRESTKCNRRNTYNLLTLFKSDIGFRDITPQFVHDFEKFLFDYGYRLNTIAKHMKHLKAFVNSAIDRGFIDANDYPFRRYKIKMCEGKHSFLLPEEMQILEQLELKGRNAGLRHTLDGFLFCCYTGLRYSDFINLSDKNIVRIDEKPWIIFNSVKTGTEVRLPLSLLFEGKAWKMLRKWQNRWEQFFALKTNSSVNKELIRIGRLAGIKKHFSFHSARHTNATLLIYRGANITTVQKLLGHRNISTTQIYSEVMGSTIIRDLKRCSRYWKQELSLRKNDP